MTINDVTTLAGLGIAFVFVALVLPISIIAHYLSKTRTQRALSAQDEKLLADLWDVARRMEERLDNLERASDAASSASSTRLREAAHV
jgi:phage shock protein B